MCGGVEWLLIGQINSYNKADMRSCSLTSITIRNLPYYTNSKRRKCIIFDLIYHRRTILAPG